MVERDGDEGGVIKVFPSLSRSLSLKEGTRGCCLVWHEAVDHEREGAVTRVILRRS